MSMNSVELLDEIQAAGGGLEVLPNRALRCRNIPPHLRSELQRLQFVVTAILMGECDPRPAVLLSTRELKKFMRTVEKRGGCFRLTSNPLGRAGFFECELPDELTHLTTTVRDNLDAIFKLLQPRRKSSSRPKRRCSVCRTGQGCRTGGIRTYANCPICGHACVTHFRAEFGSPAGCNYTWPDPNASAAWFPPPAPRCNCPGWPQLAKLVKPKSGRKAQEKNAMPLFAPEEHGA